MLTYCQYVLAHPEDELNRNYHDTEYGYPLENDNLLFERLILEINQAGLSWSLILKKKENFRKAYLNFEMNEVAQFDEYDFLRMMNDQGIIRNRLKINAAIVNAKTIIKLQKTSGSFKQWLDMHTQYSLEEWVKLFKKNFRFTGREIVREFLLSTGYLPGSHDEDCPVYDKILQLEPPWMKNSLS